MKCLIRPISDKNLWEKTLLSFPYPSIFQTWNIGEVEKSLNNKIERIGFYDDKKLCGIAQLKYIYARRGSFVHIRGGPLFYNWRYWGYFFGQIKKRALEHKVDFIRISPAILKQDGHDIQKIKKLGFKEVPIPLLDAETAWIVDLAKSEEELLLNMRKTTRYLIKKALKMGIIIKKTTEIKAAQDLLELYRRMVREKKLVPHHGILDEFREFAKDEQALIFLGYYQKKLLGASLILFYGDEGIYHHSAHIRNEIPVSYLLQWEAIREAKSRGKKRYNFWGIEPSANSSHPWAGLTQFKKGFGGYMREFVRALDYPLSIFYYKTWLIETARRIFYYRQLL